PAPRYCNRFAVDSTFSVPRSRGCAARPPALICNRFAVGRGPDRRRRSPATTLQAHPPGGAGSRGDRLAGHDRLDGVGAVLALVAGDVAAPLRARQPLPLPGGPAARQALALRGVGQAEVDDVRRLRAEAVGGVELADQRLPADDRREAGADPLAV